MAYPARDGQDSVRQTALMVDTPSQVLLPLGWHSELIINELGRLVS